MFAWLPIIGPVIEGIVSAYNKSKDTQVALANTAAGITTTEITASTQTLLGFKDDPGIKLLRDLLLFPVIVWTDLIVWDKIVEIRHPELVWGVQPLSDATGISYLPYAAMMFLLGYVALRKR